MTDWDKYPLLSSIDSPADLKQLDESRLISLADELRRFIIETVSRTGGHLGSNLGSVELTIALHYIYDTPRDLIVWDVGSQAYSHKILTGRRKQFHTNRQYKGIAGFPRRDESPYDTYGVGHSSTSISAAVGMAVAREMMGRDVSNQSSNTAQPVHADFRVVAVIGDGGMTGGLAFEGLNNAGGSKRDITVVLNDNSMSISPSVGALSQYLTAVRSDTRFEKLKDALWRLAGRVPKSYKLRKALRGVDAGLRAMLVSGLWFERLGFRYIGPIDGHNLPELLRMFEWLRSVPGPVLVHLLTQKGKGYDFAEKDGTRLHGVNKFNPQTGPVNSTGKSFTYSGHFSDELDKIASEDSTVVAITPAMIEGSELVAFQQDYPDRCFDVGIAEQHAVIFAAGLATQGLRPVVAVYSSFLQRAYDQVVHDVALQKLPVVFGVDRAGLVGEDGPTHHGAFDISFLRHIPDIALLVPRDGEQLRKMLRASLKPDDPVHSDMPIFIRFPRGRPPKFQLDHSPSDDVWHIEILREGKDARTGSADGLIIGVGPLLADCLAVADQLNDEEGINLTVVDLQCIKPLDEKGLISLASNHIKWLSVEENVLMGGVGSALLEFFSGCEIPVKLKRIGLPDYFVTHGDRASLLKEVGLDRESLKRIVRDYFGHPPDKKRRLAQIFRVGV